MRAVDLFAGPGGWSLACQRLGITEVGIEHDLWACRTRAAAGLTTIRQDVTTIDPRRFAGWNGVIASPPCPDWSQAGKRAGRSGESGWLTDLVPVWVQAVRPRWIACEQVPPVLPIWREHAELYRSWGYSVWCGVLEAERYGVPQTRERAILIASLDREALPPEPTHQRYVPGVGQGEALECQPGLFGPGVLPWVSMADALSITDDREQVKQAGRGMIERHGERPPRHISEPSFAPLANGGGNATPGTVWRLSSRWCLQRPATAVMGDPRLSPPGHHDAATSNSQHGEGTVKLTVPQALVLQSFPPDYPVQGTKTKAFEQVGNAIPPLLAEAILSTLV